MPKSTFFFSKSPKPRGRFCVRVQGIRTWFSASWPGEMLSCSFSGMEEPPCVLVFRNERSLFVTLDGWWCWVRGWTQHATSFWSTFVCGVMALLHTADCWSTSVVCFMTTTVGLWLARRAWHARSTIFVARLALQASVREARPVSRVRRSALASPTANHALSTNTLHSCRSFWSWITICF